LKFGRARKKSAKGSVAELFADLRLFVFPPAIYAGGITQKNKK
jgi:hypothetical protein